jgi:hypothetical protein
LKKDDSKLGGDKVSKGKGQDVDEMSSRANDIAYLDRLNDSILSHDPSRKQHLIDNSRLNNDRDTNPGINARIFSTSNDLSEVIKPKNGVRLKSNRVDIGTGRYKNNNPSKMSLADYKDIANQHNSLATIAIRG